MATKTTKTTTATKETTKATKKPSSNPRKMGQKYMEGLVKKAESKKEEKPLAPIAPVEEKPVAAPATKVVDGNDKKQVVQMLLRELKAGREKLADITTKSAKELVTRVDYSLKKMKEDKVVDLQTLKELVAEVSSVVAPPAEATQSVTKKGAKPAASKEATKEAPKEEPKTEKKKGLVKKAETLPKEVELASQFPETLTIESIGEMKLLTADAVSTMEGLHKLAGDGANIVFAFYWTKRHLSQFNYDPYGINPKPFKSFPDDLDIAQLVHVSDEGRVAYVVSAYSEQVYVIKPEDLAFDTEHGLRFSAGIEYGIYEVVEA